MAASRMAPDTAGGNTSGIREDEIEVHIEQLDSIGRSLHRKRSGSLAPNDLNHPARPR